MTNTNLYIPIRRSVVAQRSGNRILESLWAQGLVFCVSKARGPLSDINMLIYNAERQYGSAVTAQTVEIEGWCFSLTVIFAVSQDFSEKFVISERTRD